MTPLHLSPRRGRRIEILCIGAHCDDIEIGCGGTVLALQRRYSDCRVHWLVLTSVPTRYHEATVSANAILGDAVRGEFRIDDLPDGLLPAHFAMLKRSFEEMKASVDPDLVLTHQVDDRHQDHRVVNEVTWQTFRDHLIWEYEIPKYEGDLGRPNFYVPLPEELAAAKVAHVMRVFESQRSKSWFKAENLLALMRLRGLECRAASGFAEAFHVRKAVADLAPLTP